MKRLLHFQVKVLTIAAVLLMIFTGVLSAKTQIDTIAIIDGGSWGSRLYVYAVNKARHTVNCIYPNDRQKEESKGKALSTLEVQKDSVIAFLNTMTAKYNNSNKPIKQLYVLATAGMRLEDSVNVQTIYNHMLDTDTIHNYKVKKAMTISGRYEGLYAWIAVNLGRGLLGASTSAPHRTQTYASTPCGIIEIGGASLQITFPVKRNDATLISRPGFCNMYSQSYLGGGLNKFSDTSNIVKGKVNKEAVIDDLNAMKFLCGDIPFYEIGWAFNELLKDTSPENALKREYVREIIHTLHYQKAVLPIHHSANPSWTQGAAFDIIINKKEPQPFDYKNPN